MSNILIDKLSMLVLKEKNLKRVLDIYYYDPRKRTEAFNELKQVKNDIEKVKFKLKIEREIKNGNNNKNCNTN